ncbi:cytochrome b5 [Lipomyces kononenkoae]|uniref:Cytochrome b5 n=1 Tax=Lipomyces kononenkoae TaxID=34357 RepID=A0ACC3SR04_LIPKO
MSKVFTVSDVSLHNSKSSLFVVIHDGVYDVTEFVTQHPGGEDVLLESAGTDVTEQFEDIGHSEEARAILKSLQLGIVQRDTKVKSTLNDNKSAISIDSQINYSGASGFLWKDVDPNIAYLWIVWVLCFLLFTKYFFGS